MKKSIAMLIAVIMLFTASIAPTYAAVKYIKVKTATYEKYKKAYKVTVPKQKKTITSQKKTISNQKKTITKLNNTISDKKQTISWLWDSLEEFGYEYNYDTHQWESTQDTSQKELIIEQTGLVVDYIRLIEKYNRWAAYYVEADGDIYVITVVREKVDVCQILN